MQQKHNVTTFLKAVQLWKKHPLHKILVWPLLIIYKTLFFYNPFNIYIYIYWRKLALRLCNRGEKGDKFDSYSPFSIWWVIIIVHFFHFKSHLQTKLKWTCTERLQNSYISLCFSHKEIISCNKNIVQLIFQFGSVNSRNLSLLTELITKTISRTTSVRRKIGAKPSIKVTKPRTSELINFVFSRQTGILSANIRFRLKNRWS